MLFRVDPGIKELSEKSVGCNFVITLHPLFQEILPRSGTFLQSLEHVLCGKTWLVETIFCSYKSSTSFPATVKLAKWLEIKVSSKNEDFVDVNPSGSHECSSSRNKSWVLLLFKGWTWRLLERKEATVHSSDRTFQLLIQQKRCWCKMCYLGLSQDSKNCLRNPMVATLWSG